MSKIQMSLISGHSKMVTLSNGEIAKRCGANERECYEIAFSTTQPILRYLTPYYGSCSTKDIIEMIDSSTTDWSKSDEAWSDDNDNFGKCLPCSYHFVLLKNLETEFSPCCQLDVKVGTRMYGDGASPAKIARHKLTCQTTTSGSIGLRICGLKVFDLSSKQWIIRNKTWGKQLTPQTIIPAISIFFFVNNRLQPDLIQCAISQLCDLRRCVRQCTWRFWSSSILFTRSAYAGSQLALHVIDFGNCNFSGNYNSPDDGFLLGISNLIAILRLLLNSLM